MPSDGERDFFLYVEGPRDGGILQAWARLISPKLARQLASRVVILGGRRPARALEHFRSEKSVERARRGLIVLDRDHHTHPAEPWVAEPDLEIFTWSRRHIESYVLVPRAIRRSLGRSVDRVRLDEWIADHVPSADDEEAWRNLNAKEILGGKNSLALGAGGRLSPDSIARAMRVEDFHPDVTALYQRMLRASGLAQEFPEVIHRKRIPLPKAGERGAQ